MLHNEAIVAHIYTNEVAGSRATIIHFARRSSQTKSYYFNPSRELVVGPTMHTHMCVELFSNNMVG